MFDDMIADMASNKKLSPKVTEPFLRGRNLNIPLVLIPQSYHNYINYITRLDATHILS